MSLRDRILSTDDIPTERLHVPQWNLTLEIRGMSGADRASMLKAAMTPDGGVDLQAFYPEVVIACAHDPETGERVFTSEDRDAIMAKSGKAIDMVATVGLRLSGMTEESQRAEGKDSSSTPSDDSTSS